MPYTLNDPPDWLKNLPKAAQRIGISIFNSTYAALKGPESTKETKARKAAWGAIKQKFYRDEDGNWKPREKQITDPYEIMDLVHATEGAKTSWFSIDLEPNRYVYVRTAMVAYSDTEGVRLEWGKNDATGDWDLATVWFDDSIFTRTAAEKFLGQHKDDMQSERFKPKTETGMFSAKAFTEERMDASEKKVYAELYVPWETDAQGHYASDIEVEKALEDFMARHARGETRGVGIEHKVFSDTAEIVQGFVARPGDKVFTPGAAVLGLECTDSTWEKVLNGELNGLSMSGKWDMIPIIPADETSKGIWQITNIRIDEPSLVLKGAIRRDFKMFKSDGPEITGAKAQWTRAFINDLPDAAFAYIEKAYRDGDTKNKTARHAPHHNKNVRSSTEKNSVDLPHLRNALARVNQIKSVTGESADTIRAKAKAHLVAHAKQWGVGQYAKGEHVDIEAIIAGLDALIGSGTKSASDEWWLQKARGGSEMLNLDVRGAKKIVLQALNEVMGEKTELEKISSDDLSDAKSTAAVINALISSVNSIQGTMKSLVDGFETMKSQLAGGEGAPAGGEGEGAPAPPAKPAEGEGKPAGEGEGGEGEGEGQGEGEGGGEGAGGGEGEGEGGGAETPPEGGAKSLTTDMVVSAFVKTETALNTIMSRLDALEKGRGAKGLSMQELLKDDGGTKSGGNGGRYHSTILGTSIPREKVDAYRNKGKTKTE